MSERRTGRAADPASTSALIVLAVAAALLLIYPVIRIGALPSINYNEGWNAYRDRMAALGVPLYASLPRLSITNYPFLSFHLVGALGELTGDLVLAGRIVSLVALLASAAVVGVIVRRSGGSRRAGVFAGSCLLLWIATTTPERRAMDDPGLLALAVATVGLVLAIGRSRSGTAASGVAFAVALFVKQDIVALPLAIAAELALARRWRILALLIGSGVATALLLLALTAQLDGPHFLAHLLRPRLYRPANLGRNAETVAFHVGIPIALVASALLRSVESGPRRRLAWLLLLAGAAVSLPLAGGDGVAPNVFYPLLVALAVSAGALFPAAPPPGRPAVRHPLATAALAASAASAIGFVPAVLAADLVAWGHLPELTRAARHTAGEIRAAGGPALCEDILLCFRAGKPIGPDPFFVHDQLLTGRLSERDILDGLNSRRYGAIEIDGEVGRGGVPIGDDRRRFDAAFMRALLANYRVVSSVGGATLLEPPTGPESRTGRN